MWAAKHCSMLFSSGQNRLCVFCCVLKSTIKSERDGMSRRTLKWTMLNFCKPHCIQLHIILFYSKTRRFYSSGKKSYTLTCEIFRLILEQLPEPSFHMIASSLSRRRLSSARCYVESFFRVVRQSSFIVTTSVVLNP